MTKPQGIIPGRGSLLWLSWLPSGTWLVHGLWPWHISCPISHCVPYQGTAPSSARPILASPAGFNLDSQAMWHTAGSQHPAKSLLEMTWSSQPRSADGRKILGRVLNPADHWHHLATPTHPCHDPLRALVVLFQALGISAPFTPVPHPSCGQIYSTKSPEIFYSSRSAAGRDCKPSKLERGGSGASQTLSK